MLEINLLPENLKKNTSDLSIDISKLPILRITGIVLVAIIGLQFLLGMVNRIQRSRLSKVRSAYEAMLPDKTRLDKLKSERYTVLTRIDALDGFDESGIKWSGKLSRISQLINPGVWLNKMEIKRQIVQRTEEMLDPATNIVNKRTIKVPRRSLAVHGTVVSLGGGEETALVSKFIKNLKSDDEFFKDFTDIELETIRRDRIKDIEVMEFIFACYFKDDKNK